MFVDASVVAFQVERQKIRNVKKLLTHLHILVPLKEIAIKITYPIFRGIRAIEESENKT